MRSATFTASSRPGKRCASVGRTRISISKRARSSPPPPSAPRGRATSNDPSELCCGRTCGAARPVREHRRVVAARCSTRSTAKRTTLPRSVCSSPCGSKLSRCRRRAAPSRRCCNTTSPRVSTGSSMRFVREKVLSRTRASAFARGVRRSHVSYTPLACTVIRVSPPTCRSLLVALQRAHRAPRQRLRDVLETPQLSAPPYTRLEPLRQLRAKWRRPVDARRVRRGHLRG